MNNVSIVILLNPINEKLEHFVKLWTYIGENHWVRNKKIKLPKFYGLLQIFSSRTQVQYNKYDWKALRMRAELFRVNLQQS